MAEQTFDFSGFPVDVAEIRQPVNVAWPGGGEIPHRALAIVGSHPDGLEHVPWDDPRFEIWVFNEAPLKPEKFKRWDALVQIHGVEVYSSPTNWVNPDYWPWLQQRHGKPIYMQDVDERVPDSVRYPLEGVLSLVPFRYLRSSPAMALALAIYQGYKEIHLFGSELSSNTEYAYQATNYAFWIGYALGHGIDLHLRCWKREFDQRIYGYDGELQISKDYFAQRYETAREAYRQNERNVNKLQDKLLDALIDNKFDEVAKLHLELVDGLQITGQAAAAMAEADRYRNREDMISRQEYERRAAQAQKDGNDIEKDMWHGGGEVSYVWNLWKQFATVNVRTQLKHFMEKQWKAARECGEKAGQFRENIEYMREYDDRLTAAGGVRALGAPQ